MQLRETPLAGAFEVELEPREDDRGFFARSWCAREFAAAGLPGRVVQASLSHNSRRGTLRGLHFQWPPSHEGKLVRCEAGAVHDVIVDLRPAAASFGTHFALRLEAARGNALYVPPGVAHGFQVLEDDTRVGYLMTDVHAPGLAGGVRWDDPAFGIEWPLAVTEISARDAAWPDFDPAAHEARFRAGGGA